MTYADGNTPKIGDIIRSKAGRRALVTKIQLVSGTTSWPAQITVDLDSGDAGINVSAEEFTLVSRDVDTETSQFLVESSPGVLSWPKYL